MAICRDCGFVRGDMADPTKGVCTFGSEEREASEVVAGEAQRVVRGKAVRMRDEACENFTPKGDREERLRKGF